MHITTDALTNAVAMAAGMTIDSKLIDAWGKGAVEFYQAIGEWAVIVTEEEAHLSEAIDGDGWPGVFAYEVSESIGADIYQLIIDGGEVTYAIVRNLARIHIASFCRITHGITPAIEIASLRRIYFNYTGLSYTANPPITSST